MQYLNEEVGARFSPSIRFDSVVMSESKVVSLLAAGEVDFGILDATAATCSVRQSDGKANTILTLQEKIHGRFGLTLTISAH